jgi:hypothetical protein
MQLNIWNQMNDIEAKAIIQKIAESTQSVNYMVAQMQQFLYHNPTYTKRVIYQWIQEVNPVLADNMTKWII